MAEARIEVGERGGARSVVVTAQGSVVAQAEAAEAHVAVRHLGGVRAALFTVAVDGAGDRSYTGARDVIVSGGGDGHPREAEVALARGQELVAVALWP